MNIQDTPIAEMAQKLGAKTVGEFLDLFGKFMDSQESNPVEEPSSEAPNTEQLSARHLAVCAETGCEPAVFAALLAKRGQR